MPGCKAQTGISNICGDLLFPGGADGDFWVGYVSDLATKFSLTQATVISSISFLPYTGLVKFSAAKFANKFDWEFQKGAGGNGFFVHRGAVKLIALSVPDDVEIQRLLQGVDIFIINKNNNGSFLIYGAGNGLQSVAGPLGSTGQALGDDVSDTVTLEGAEKTKPLRFLVTDEATTLSYLAARTI